MPLHLNFKFFLKLGLICFVFLGFTLSLYSQDKLVLISPHWEGIKTEFGQAFQRWYQSQIGHSVELDWRDMGGANDDLRFILSEFQQTPSGIGIDLFFGGGIDPFLELKQRGYLEAYHLPKSLMDGIPSFVGGLPLYDPDGDWYGTALSSFGILKNERVVTQLNLPAVHSWRDLTHPALKGWIGSGDPRNSGATHMVYESILQSYGWQEGWKVIQAMAANIRQFDRNGSSTAKACTIGNVAYALVIDFYGFTQIAEAGPENMSLIIPKGESILNPDSIAILKGAPNRQVAKKFLEFVLSDLGQSLWLAPLGHLAGPKKFAIQRMSVRPALYQQFASVTSVKINPFLDLQPLLYDSQLGTLRWSSLNAFLGATMIDRSVEERQKLRIVISEEEFLNISKYQWKDPVKRNRLQLSWQSAK